MIQCLSAETPPPGCGCAGCAAGRFQQLSSEEQPPVLGHFMLGDGGWSMTGSAGGLGQVVTWSLAGAGLADQTGQDFFTGSTVEPGSLFTGFDYTAVIRQAFDAWAAAANITFIQVADGGGNIGIGASADIRISAAAIDGSGATLAKAFFPGVGGYYRQDAIPGDMVLDKDELEGGGSFWTAQSLYLVVLHELGHSLGLEHELTTNAIAIMNPSYNAALYNTGPLGNSLQQDDINGAQAVYGAPAAGAKAYFIPAGQSAFAALDVSGTALFIGNGLGNTITGTADTQTIIGGEGADYIDGRAGADALYGGYSGSAASGISLGAGSVVKNAGTGNSSLGAALDLSALFSLAANADIEDAAVTPHVTVNAAGSGSVDYYKIQINNAGAIITLDIDATSALLDTEIHLLNSAGTILAEDDDAIVSWGAAGSAKIQDSYLQFYAAAPGAYYIAVGSYLAAGLDPVAAGEAYSLHVSVAGEMFLQLGGIDTLYGGDGNDTLAGTANADVLSGDAGDDSVTGGDFADALYGGAGNDTLSGGDGADTIIADAGDDSISGGAADDAIYGGDGNDTVDGGAGINYIEAGYGNDSVTGAGSGTIYGGAGNDSIAGGIGSALLSGDHGADTISGGSGSELIYIDAMDAAVTGGGGNDFLVVADTAGVSQTAGDIENWYGFTGADNFDASAAAVLILMRGNAGNDTLTGGSGGDYLYGDADNDSITGGDGNDVLAGGAGADQLFGGLGTDVLYVDAADIFFSGGSGTDYLILEDPGNAGANIDITASSIEWATGRGGNDTINAAGSGSFVELRGDDGNDRLTAGGPGSILLGGNGNDTLAGGAGVDHMVGGAGADAFAFNINGGTDYVYDFDKAGGDKIDLAAMGAFGGFAALAIDTSYSGVNYYSYTINGTTVWVLSAQGALAAGDFVFA